MFEAEKDAKYVKSKAKASDIASFLKDYKAGKLERFIKSAPVPEDPYEEDVYVLVASTLEE